MKHSKLKEKKFGLLTAKEIVGKDRRGYLWRCECECGGEKIVPASYLRNQHTKSCGCLIRNIRENAIKKGDRFGFLEADEFVCYETRKDGKRRAVWLFRCDCGTEKAMAVGNVKFGNVRSCGCKARAHISNLNKEDITGERYERLKAIRPTNKRDSAGSIVWIFECECGNTVELSVGTFHSGKVHSCGCLYKESRKDCTTYRRDFVEGTCLSSIISAKKPSALNTSGHTGVYLDKRSGKWFAYINFRKKRYHLGTYDDIDAAIIARKKGEEKIHDPTIIDYYENLTTDKKNAFSEYLRTKCSNSATISI